MDKASNKETKSKMTLADRHNIGKERWALVDYEALKPMVHVLAFGAKKYSDDNWRKGLKTKEVCESLLRHITAYLSGQDNDQESGLPEVGHILCNAMFLSHMHLFRLDMDTRVKPEKTCCGKWNEYGECACQPADIYSDSAVEDLKAWMKKNNIKNPVEFIKTELPGLVETRGQEFVERTFEESGGILKGISPEDMLKQERQNARVRRS